MGAKQTGGPSYIPIPSLSLKLSTLLKMSIRDPTYLNSTIAYTVIAALWITPLAVLWFISLRRAHRRGDPARAGVAWMKAVLPLWVM